MKNSFWLLCWGIAWTLSACQTSTCTTPLVPKQELLRVTAVVSSTAVLYQYWSPNGQYFVVEGEQDYHPLTAYSTIYTSKQDKEATVYSSYIWGGIVGWTTDSRYALFSSGDQYGDADAIAFDTQEWTMHGLKFGTEKEQCGMGSACRHGIVAIAPKTSRVVIADGNLIDLTNFAYTSIISATGKNSIRLVAWSPDERYLIFVAHQYKDGHDNDYALYLANGDGTQVRLLSPINSTAKAIAWGTDGQCASISATKEIYIVDLANDQVRAWPVP